MVAHENRRDLDGALQLRLLRASRLVASWGVGVARLCGS